jgi:PAS domain S-box-containing protein
MTAEPSHAVLRTALQTISEGVLVWSVPDGTLVTCNEAAGRILGAAPSEIEGRGLDYPWQLASEDGSPLALDERGAVVAVRTGQSQPPRLVRVGRPDGTWAWVRSSSVVLRDATNAPNAVLTTFVDVTELLQAGEQLKEMASGLAEAMAGANVGTWELDLDTGRVVRNARWAEILGLTPSEVEPTLSAFIERIHPDERARCSAAIQAAFVEGVAFVIECRARHQDGHWHWVQGRGKVAERSGNGRSRRVAGVLVDIDARKQTEEMLRLAVAENERLVLELRAAMENVRALEGLLPICMYCKAIRDDEGAWSSVESYVSGRARVAFSHGICPTCFTRHFPGDTDL